MSDTPNLVDPNGVVISSQMLDRARQLRAQREQAKRAARNPFEPAQPFPGVVPTDAKLAMDSEPADWFGQAAVAWTSEGYYSSSFAEGTTFLGYSELALLAQRAEYRVASQTIAEDMTREWIEFEASGDEDKTDKIKQLTDECERLQLQRHFETVTLYDGLLGRAHLYVDTDETDNKDELKLNLGYGDNITEAWFKAKDLKVKAFRPVEATWAYPNRYESNNPLSGEWYNPETWFVMSREIHRSRFLTFVGRPVPDILKPAFAFGGLSITQMMKPYVDNWLQTRQAVANAVTKFSTNVLKTAMGAAVQGIGGDRFFARVDFFNQVRDNSGTLVVDKDTEDFVNISMPLGGLEGLQAQSQEHMAAVTRIPLVKLLGIHPAGLNASADGDIKVYYDTIHAAQEKSLRPNLTVTIRLVQISLWGAVDPAITYKFKPLWQQDEGEIVGNEKSKAEIDAGYIADGVIDAAEARRRIATDKRSQYSGLNLDPDKLPEPPDEGAPMPGEEEAAVGGPIEEDEVAGQKFSKIAAQFEHPAKGDDRCGECIHFLPHLACDKVDGLVRPEDWCTLFEAAAMRRPAAIRSRSAEPIPA